MKTCSGCGAIGAHVEPCFVASEERAEKAEAERDRLRLELTQSRNDLDIARKIAGESGQYRARVAELEAALKTAHILLGTRSPGSVRQALGAEYLTSIGERTPDSVGTNQTSAAGQKPTDEHNRKERDDMRAAGEKPDSVEANASRGAGQRHSDRAESRPDDQFHPQFTGTCALADGAVKSAPYSPNDLRPSDARYVIVDAYGAEHASFESYDEAARNVRAHKGERIETRSIDASTEPYWKRLPLELQASVLETHYLTAKQCLEETAAERDMWKKRCDEWTRAAHEARERVRELEAAADVDKARIVSDELEARIAQHVRIQTRERCAQELYDQARRERDAGRDTRAMHTEACARRLQGVDDEGKVIAPTEPASDYPRIVEDALILEIWQAHYGWEPMAGDQDEVDKMREAIRGVLAKVKP